ncbi:hypothetical protein [Saccharothrix obliqua]|uniref:hypothetical protein n=1 Tax=Saccharothrix obliqua TaxID=2861747 RepID=UPI002151A4F1|nr:hypothetical protein [Saccharothrix obliqua]
MSTALAVYTLVTPVAAGYEELPPAAGWASATASAINEAGQVAGTTGSPSRRPVPGYTYGVRWDGRTPTVLGGGDPAGEAYGVNARGDVAFSIRLGYQGISYVNFVVWENGRLSSRTSPVWSAENGPVGRDISDAGVVPMAHRGKAGTWREGVFHALPLPVEAVYTDHRAVNAHGTTAGAATLDGSFVFHCDVDECTRLPSAGEGGSYRVAAISESNAVAATWTVGATTRAVLWTGGRPAVLPGADAVVSDHRRAVSESGDVVGSRRVDGVSRATLWRNGELVDLGAAGTSVAVAVNDRGDVIGWQRDGGPQRPFHWRDGVLTLLPAPAGVSVEPADINNSGVVVGGTRGETPSRAFRWTVAG